MDLSLKLMQKYHEISYNLIIKYCHSIPQDSSLKLHFDNEAGRRGLLVDFVEWSLFHEGRSRTENLKFFGDLLKKLGSGEEGKRSADYLRLCLEKWKWMAMQDNGDDPSFRESVFGDYVGESAFIIIEISK